ncbi:MAG: glycosyltransferase family 4 protein [Bacteroidia bacterium]|jgi:glycosyltransferase involved in cell wall biosynthesis|nr:glycosyltransferase family 4 protein [Bacteroidia bacterium]
MKVLHVSTPMSWRGGEQQAAYLARALKEMKVEVSVLTPLHSELSTRLKEDGVTVINFKSRGLLDLSLAKKIAKICNEQKFDVVHTHDSHAHSAAVLSAAVFSNMVPIVVSRRVDFAVSSNLFSKWKYNHASIKKIICVSEMILNITAPSMNDKKKLTVVHSGINTTNYNFSLEGNLLKDELNLSQETILIGNLSALADHKDFPTFLKVAKEVIHANPFVHFIIAGTGDEKSLIDKFIDENNLSSRIHLLGFRKDVTKVMKSLDVFLITSKTEGLGTIVLEAFAAEIPVVATRAGGIPELVSDGVTGLLVEVGDVSGLTRAVQKVLADHELRMKIISNAKSKVQEFSFQATAQKTLNIYQEIIKN